MRRIRYDMPRFLSGEILEEAPDAGEAHEFVARTYHGENRHTNSGCLTHSRERKIRHSAKHCRSDAAHDERISDQSDGSRRGEIPPTQPFEDDFGIAGYDPCGSRDERDETLANSRSESARRNEHKPLQLWNATRRCRLNSNGAAHTFA